MATRSPRGSRLGPGVGRKVIRFVTRLASVGTAACKFNINTLPENWLMANLRQVSATWAQCGVCPTLVGMLFSPDASQHSQSFGREYGPALSALSPFSCISRRVGFSPEAAAHRQLVAEWARLVKGQGFCSSEISSTMRAQIGFPLKYGSPMVARRSVRSCSLILKRITSWKGHPLSLALRGRCG